MTETVQSSATGDMRLLVADRIAQEGINLLREELPEAHIDTQPGLKPEQLLAQWAAVLENLVHRASPVHLEKCHQRARGDDDGERQITSLV